MFLNLLTAKIIGGVAIVGLIGGVYLYISHLKSSLATLEANNVKLNFAVEQQKELIEQQNKDIIVVANYFKDYQKLNNSLNKSLNTLNEKFNKKNAEDVQRDLGKIAKAKSKLIEKIINKGSNNSLRCLEIAMGASLTDEEKGATKRSEINSECYDIANPSYSDNGN